MGHSHSRGLRLRRLQRAFGNGSPVLMGSTLAVRLQGKTSFLGPTLFFRRGFGANPSNVTPIKSLLQHTLSRTTFQRLGSFKRAALLAASIDTRAFLAFQLLLRAKFRMRRPRSPIQNT